MGQFPYYTDKGRDMKAVWDIKAVREESKQNEGREIWGWERELNEKELEWN